VPSLSFGLAVVRAGRLLLKCPNPNDWALHVSGSYVLIPPLSDDKLLLVPGPQNSLREFQDAKSERLSS
jgi:hypothetical protein